MPIMTITTRSSTMVKAGEDLDVLLCCLYCLVLIVRETPLGYGGYYSISMYSRGSIVYPLGGSPSGSSRSFLDLLHIADQ